MPLRNNPGQLQFPLGHWTLLLLFFFCKNPTKKKKKKEKWGKKINDKVAGRLNVILMNFARSVIFLQDGLEFISSDRL